MRAHPLARTLAALGLAVALALPAPARAAPPDAAAGAEAPDQRLALDPDPPRPAFSGGGDVLGPVFGLYEARVVAALAGWHALALDVGAVTAQGRWRARVAAGWQGWFLGRGLEGPWVGLALGLEAGPGGAALAAPTLAEAGVQGVWGAVAVGVAAVLEGDLLALRAPPRFRVALRVGWVVAG